MVFHPGCAAMTEIMDDFDYVRAALRRLNPQAHEADHSLLNRQLATPTASSLANEGYAALGRLEEQYTVARESSEAMGRALAAAHTKITGLEDQLESEQLTSMRLRDEIASIGLLTEIYQEALEEIAEAPARSSAAKACVATARAALNPARES